MWLPAMEGGSLESTLSRVGVNSSADGASRGPFGCNACPFQARG